MMETIEKEEEIGQRDSGLREWTEDNDNEMSNMVNPEYKL